MTALDTGTEDLQADIDGGVAVITMNRPSRRFIHRLPSRARCSGRSRGRRCVRSQR